MSDWYFDGQQWLPKTPESTDDEVYAAAMREVESIEREVGLDPAMFYEPAPVKQQRDWLSIISGASISVVCGLFVLNLIFVNVNIALLVVLVSFVAMLLTIIAVEVSERKPKNPQAKELADQVWAEMKAEHITPLHRAPLSTDLFDPRYLLNHTGACHKCEKPYERHKPGPGTTVYG